MARVDEQWTDHINREMEQEAAERSLSQLYAERDADFVMQWLKERNLAAVPLDYYKKRAA